MAAGRGQSRPGAGYFWLNGAGEHHADRVEEDELGMMSDSLGHRVPRRVGDEARELFDSFAHPELLAVPSSLSIFQLNPSSFSATVRLSSTIDTMRAWCRSLTRASPWRRRNSGSAEISIARTARRGARDGRSYRTARALHRRHAVGRGARGCPTSCQARLPR